MYRLLVRHGLVSAIAAKRRRTDYRRGEPPGADAAVPAGCHLTGPVAAAAGPRNQADFRTELGSVIAKVASPAMDRASCTAFRASWRSSLCFQVAHQAGNLIGIRGEKLLGGRVSANDSLSDVR